MIMRIRVETHIHRKQSAEEQSKSEIDHKNDDGISFSIEVSGNDEHSIRLKIFRKKTPATLATLKKTTDHTIFKNASGMKYDFKSVLKTFVGKEWDNALKVNSTKKSPRSKGTKAKKLIG